MDGNPKLTLGLIWTIILHFQISDIIQHEENELPKEVLLKWAQMTTDAYPNVSVRDFTNSWKDGLAFLAILHRNNPQLINFREKLNRPARENLELAFSIFEKDFNICRLLDPEDVDTAKPDEKSLITYISSIYELFKEIPAYNQFKDVDFDSKVNEYNQLAGSILAWVRDKTAKLNDLTWRGQPNIILQELYDDLQEFYNKELPLCMQEKLKLKELHKQLVKFGLDGEIGKEHGQTEIECEWNRLLNAFNLRKSAIKEDLTRVQRIAEKIVDESEHCHLNLEQIKSAINEQAERIERLSKEDNERNFGELKRQLDEEAERIGQLNTNLEPLNEVGYRHYDELVKKVKQLELLHKHLLNQHQLKLVDQLEFRLEHLRRQEEYELANQKLLQQQQLLQAQLEEQKKQKPLTEEELIASNAQFANLANCIGLVENYTADLQSERFAANAHGLAKQSDRLEQEKLRLRKQFNASLQDLQAARGQVTKPSDQAIYGNLLNRLEKALGQLNETFDLKSKQLAQLLTFIGPAEQELAWLVSQEEIEINRDWSCVEQLNLKQLDARHRQLIQHMNEREDQFTDCIDKGERLIEAKHESTDLAQETINKMQLQWSFLLQLSVSLETHLKHLEAAQAFNEQLADCNGKFDAIEASLAKIDCKQSKDSIQDGQRLLTEIHQVKDEIHEHAQSIKEITLRSKKIVPFRARKLPLSKAIKVSAACMIKQPTGTMEQGEQCVLVDNSTKAKWTVKTANQTKLVAPGCCFVLNPPDKEAVDATDRLKRRCEQLSNLWAYKEHRLKQNIIKATLNVVKSWDYSTYTKMDPAQRNGVLSALESDIEKLDQNKPKQLDEVDGQTNGHTDCADLIGEMNALKERFRAFDERIASEQNAKSKRDENLERYIELADQIVAELTEKKNILVQRAQDPIPRDSSSFEQMILDHKLFQTEYDQLAERIENANQLFNQIEKKPFEMQSQHNSMIMLSSHTDELIDLFTQRLQELGNIFSNYDECLDATSALEIKFALLDDMPADEIALNRLADVQLKEIEQKMKHGQTQFDNIQLNLNNLKQIIEKTRPKQQATHVDLYRLEEDVKSLNRRWDTLGENLVKFRSAIERYSNLLANYRNKMDHDRAWLSQMVGQVNEALSNNDLEMIQTNMDELEKREAQIQELSVLSARLIHEAQNYDQSLKQYREDLEEVHPSLDGNLCRDQQAVSGQEQIAAEMEALQVEYQNLCYAVLNHISELEEECKRANEEAAELEDLQLEIAVKEMANLCDNLQKIAIWLNAMEQIYEQPLKSSRLMETLQSQITEQQEVLGEINEQRTNLNQLQEKANELNMYNETEDDQLLPDDIIPNALRSLGVLNEKVLDRIEQLKAAIKESQDFYDSLDELRNWLEQQENEHQLAVSIHIGNDSAAIKEMLLKHKQFQRKLNAKQAIYDVVMKIGRSLKEKSPKEEVAVIQAMLNDLKAEWVRICNQSVDRQRRLEEALLIAGQFKDALQALFDWIEKAKESIQDDRVFGDRDTVLHLIEAHRLFQEELKNRSKNLNQVRKFCNELVQAAGGDQKQIGNIPGQLDDLENRWEEINKLSDAREFQLQDALEHSEKLQKSLTELFAWLQEVDDRLRFTEQMPDDEETTRRQIGEHVKFIAKLNEQEQNKQRSISLAKETLTKCHPDAISVINHWITTIETLWSDVTAHAKQREAKLNEHLDKLEEMFKLLDELHGWLVESEASLVKRDSEVMPEEIDTLQRLIDEHETFIETMSGKQKDIEKIARTFAVKKVPSMSSSQSVKSNASATRISDLKRKAGGTSFTVSGQFSSPGKAAGNHLSPFKHEEIRNPKAKDLIDKWRSVWLLSIEHKRRLKDQLEHCKEMEKMKTFEFDEWRNRFTNWLKSNKARALDFFKKMDKDNDGKLSREQFIDGFLKSKFTTSRMELEYVTPIFDRNQDGIIGQKEFLDTLRQERDLTKTDNEIIQNEIHCKWIFR